MRGSSICKDKIVSQSVNLSFFLSILLCPPIHFFSDSKTDWFWFVQFIWFSNAWLPVPNSNYHTCGGCTGQNFYWVEAMTDLCSFSAQWPIDCRFELVPRRSTFSCGKWKWIVHHVRLPVTPTIRKFCWRRFHKAKLFVIWYHWSVN